MDHPAAIKGQGSATNPNLTVVAIPKERIVPAPTGHGSNTGEAVEPAKDVVWVKVQIGVVTVVWQVQRRLRKAICLSMFFMILEIVGGILAHSLAIVR